MAIGRGERLSLASSGSRARRSWLAVASVVALGWLLVARVAGPSDAFDQTQPRTISYTTDIIVHGRWVLPIERGETLATKPPLYNWLAVPVVALVGFSSELGHKLPSVLALLVAWSLLAWLGERLGPPGLGWLASLAFCANYTIFKLGYLARPDMLLTTLLLLGWAAATALLVAESPRSRPGLRLVFWSCFALALLAKGPAALALPLYALVAAPLVGGGRPGWRAARRLAWWAMPLSLAPFAAWMLLVYREAPDHLVQQLWFEEFYGRITGLGGEGTGRGPIELVRRAGHMPAYFLIRFAPWSILAVLAIVVLWRDRGRPTVTPRPWLVGAAAYAVLTVILFSLSAGKRADYMAGAIAPASLLAAWLLVARLRPAWTWFALSLAGVALGASTVYNQLNLGSPVRGLGPAIAAFVEEVEPHLRDEPLPVTFWTAGTSQLQAVLGYSTVDGPLPVREQLLAGEPFWVVAGRRPDEPRSLEQWLDGLTTRWRIEVTAEAVVVSDQFRWTDMWPEQVGLYRVEAAGTAPEFNGSTRRFR